MNAHKELKKMAAEGYYAQCHIFIRNEMRLMAQIVRDARLERFKGQGSLLLPPGEITDIINSGNTE